MKTAAQLREIGTFAEKEFVKALLFYCELAAKNGQSRFWSYIPKHLDVYEIECILDNLDYEMIFDIENRDEPYIDERPKSVTVIWEEYDYI